MCRSCYENYGSPDVRTPGVLNAVRMIQDAESLGARSASFHAVVEDWNIEDYHINPAAQDNQHPTTREIMRALQPLSKAERATVLALVEGILE